MFMPAIPNWSSNPILGLGADRRLQAEYARALTQKWRVGAVVGRNWIAMMAGCIMDAIHATAFLPTYGHMTFRLARWAFSAQQKASAVFERVGELKAELARRGIRAPKLSLWGKAKSVLKGGFFFKDIKYWAEGAQLVDDVVTDQLTDDDVFVQVSTGRIRCLPTLY
jgi:hypothetical protein